MSLNLNKHPTTITLDLPAPSSTLFKLQSIYESPAAHPIVPKRLDLPNIHPSPRSQPAHAHPTTISHQDKPPTLLQNNTKSHPLTLSTAPMASQPTPDTPTQTTSYTDPTFSLLNVSCLDLLLIELVPMAYRITADLAAREEEWLQPSRQNRLSGTTSNDASSTVAGTGAGGAVGGTGTVDEEEAREAVFHRLEGLGYRVGLGVVERCVLLLQKPLLMRS